MPLVVDAVTESVSGLPGRPLSRYILLLGSLVFCLLSGCAGNPVPRAAVDALPPLQVDGELVAVEDVARLAPTPDLLATTEDMRKFVSRYAAGVNNPRQRLTNLHRAVSSPAMLDLQYDPFADGSAVEVFERGSANCLAYTHLFVALAREAGLEAHYQWLEQRPQWTRMGERVALQLHVNVVVKLRGGEQYMVDIDPLPSREIADTRLISDADAAALYHNNLAMDALANGDLAGAWLQLVRGLQLSPGLAQLWVNLGAIYRAAGQLEVAEQSYFQALRIDPHDRSAMNNLTVLYRLQGREHERAYWAERVQRYQTKNPFYHAWQGDMAGEEGDWDSAREHYLKALSLRPEDSRLLYSLGIVQYERGDYDEATSLIGRAIDRANLQGDIENYRLQLEAVQREAMALR